MNTDSPKDSLTSLEDRLKPMGKLVVAYSGGVDSSVVMAAAARALGPESVLAVTALSETLPRREMEAARSLASELAIPHTMIETGEMENGAFRSNPPDRCYHCKTELWRCVGGLALSRGISNVADGVNADDAGDYRPGMKASNEAGVVHPLADIGAGKSMVRHMARELGLPNWDKPAQACLSSRFPYGQEITVAGLKRVEAAEDFLAELGLSEFRVRDHDGVARIEAPPETLNELAGGEKRAAITTRFRELGFAYITLDLEGFRSGSMNETL